MDAQGSKQAEVSATRILLTGTYCSVNKGDACMQAVFVLEFQRYQRGSLITIASPFPERDVAYYAPTPVIKSRRRNLLLATFHWVMLEFLSALGIRLSRYPLSEEIDGMIHADAVVDLSGDMLTEDYGPLVGYSHFLPLMQAQALGRPVIICAQSVGPFHRLTPLARRILSRAKLITVRDQVSVGLLERLQHSGNSPIHTADLAFLLKPAEDARIDELLTAEGIVIGSRPLVGVSVSALLLNRNNRHVDVDTGDKLEVFARALDTVSERLEVDLLLVPHVFGPRSNADDREVCERLAQRMRYAPQRLRGEYRPEELKGVIARCDAFVGCRMHANIAALDSIVPVLAVGYSHKTRGILADLGLDEWVLPVAHLTTIQLIEGIERLLKAAPCYRHQLKERLPAIRVRAGENIEAVARIIAPGHEGNAL